jgi:hypothetical protein
MHYGCQYPKIPQRAEETAAYCTPVERPKQRRFGIGAEPLNNLVYVY